MNNLTVVSDKYQASLKDIITTITEGFMLAMDTGFTEAFSISTLSQLS